ncbi:hypothetical protein [Actinomadura rubrisoli]|uniref:DUF3558 domain-containing protein n=1 Tax=Actinomadura rubrisoli TaxID=2530368 RepID=A0A4R5B818_9ACTN|nr:hypothetical protein [Actinomadura rubrisoli]TDD81109.1 hypothetical protein E1298_24610 [Actinomadura rubrisoli]
MKEVEVVRSALRHAVKAWGRNLRAFDGIGSPGDLRVVDDTRLGGRPGLALICAIPVVMSMASACSDSGKDESPAALTDTKVTVPDPCALISPSLADYLVGASIGKKGDGARNSATPECTWENRGFVDKSRKQGEIAVHVVAQLKRQTQGDQFLQARTSYTAFTSGKECQKLDSVASETCWYHQPNGTLGVVLWKDYRVVWVNITATGSPGLAPKELARSANRVATDVSNGLP